MSTLQRFNEAQLMKTGETDQEREDSLAYFRFMSKPEIIRMHLEILYKSIQFLSKDKIQRVLNDYKFQKAQKQKEEEERMQLQSQLRKLRGRSTSKKERSKDEFNL